jgi:hypothetical protein
MRKLPLFLLTLTFSGFLLAQAPVPPSVTAPKTDNGPGPLTIQPTKPLPSNVRGIAVVVSLRTSLTSKNAPEGKEIKTTLEHAVTLPDGTVLSRNTVIRGVVAHASQHTKQKPNGALMLVFSEALSKSEAAPVPLFAKMRQLATATNDTVTLPGARLGGTSNAGGTEQLSFESNTQGSMTSNVKSSGLAGILLDATAPGSGVLYALDGDVFLDEGTQITLLIAKASPTYAPASPKP